MNAEPVASRPRTDTRAIARGAIAFVGLGITLYFVEADAGKYWSAKHQSVFVVAAPLLAFLLPWPRCSWRDVSAVALGCALGFGVAAVMGAGTEDTDLRPWPVAVGVFVASSAVAWLVCLGVASLAKAAHAVILRRSRD